MHLSTKQMSSQTAVELSEIMVAKLPRERNAADLVPLSVHGVSAATPMEKDGVPTPSDDGRV